MRQYSDAQLIDAIQSAPQIAPGRWNRSSYDPDEIDYFFVIDGDFNFDVIPVAAVGGFTAIRLSAYHEYSMPRQALTP